MKAAVLRGVHDLGIEDVPGVEEVSPGHLLIEIEAVGICGSDIHYYEKGRIGSHVVSAPMILGHEAAGRVVGRGPGVPAGIFNDGAVVALEPGIPCGACAFCRVGDYNFCPSMRFFATPPYDGALRETVLHPAGFTFAADGLTALEAALAEPLSVGVYATRLLGLAPGDRVLVVGGGPVGLLAALAGEAAGADVVVAEIDPIRVRMGRDAGFSVASADDPAVSTYDCAIDCTGSETGIRLAQMAVRTHGQLGLIGLGERENMRLDGLDIVQRGILVHGVFRYANTYPTALAILRRFRSRLEPFLTHLVPLDRLPEVLSKREYLSTLKTMVVL